MVQTGYYPDGVTKITDPFYQCICRNCCYFFLGLMIDSKCPKCQSDDVFRSFSQDEAREELERLEKIKVNKRIS